MPESGGQPRRPPTLPRLPLAPPASAFSLPAKLRMVAEGTPGSAEHEGLGVGFEPSLEELLPPPLLPQAGPPKRPRAEVLVLPPKSSLPGTLCF